MARHRIHSLAFKKQIVQEYAPGRSPVHFEEQHAQRLANPQRRTALTVPFLPPSCCVFPSRPVGPLRRPLSKLMETQFAGAGRKRNGRSGPHHRPPCLLVSLPDVVSHHRAAQAKWLWLAFSRVAGGLMLHLRVQLAAEQDNYGGDPQPDHEADTGAK
jgi:hypothetical protein